MPKVQTKKTNKKLNYKEGIAVVSASFNNTIITISDKSGNVSGWSSAGACGFKGVRKSTPYAAQVAASRVGSAMKEAGLEALVVRIKGAGPGRDSSVRALHQSGLHIKEIVDVTPIAHNGCRPPKKRRV